MAYDLKATLKLVDEFTRPMQNALRSFDSMDSQMRDIDRQWSRMQGSANDATDGVRDLGRETERSADVASDLQREIDRAADAADDLGGAGRNAGSDLRRAGEQGRRAGDGVTSAFKKAAGILATVFAVDQVKDLAVGMIEATGGANAMTAQFSEVFKGMEDEASKSLASIADENTILENRMKGSFTKIAAFAKTGGMDTADSLDLANRSMRAVADGAAFYDRSLEDTTESLQSFLKGNFENDAALGLSATETTRNSAANDLYGKSFKDLDESQKQLTLLQMVEDANKVSGAMGQAARESDGLENVLGNMKQSWEDLKAVVGVAIFDTAIEGMKGLTEWVQNLDAQKLADGLLTTGTYLTETFGPILGEIKEDLVGLWEVLNQEGSEAGIKGVFQAVQDSMIWIADNWEEIKDGVLALTGAFLAYKGVLAGMMILQTINKLMILYHSGLLITTAQQWLLNTAMFANPIGLVALAIGALVGAGILLYQNWDTVRAKTEALWDKLGAFQGVATVVLGPLGFIIRAAVTMADQWDSTKSIWENVWNGIRIAAENSVNDVIGSINGLIDTINKIPGVNIPIVPKVDWSGVQTAPSSSMKEEMSYAEAVHGSHATGLASVPFDSYISELHKGEAVLTAGQSNTLRSMGVLKSSGDKPVLDASALSGNRTGTGRTISRSPSNSTVTMSGVTINVNGHNKPTREIASELVDEIKVAISNGALAGVY